MNITKSTRHSRIAGDFGETLFLYWLSKSGFEVALVDHTGIDMVAYDTRTEKRYGISVKSRTRLRGTENEGLYVKLSDLEKVRRACAYFGCEPYFGILVDRSRTIDAFLVPLGDLININGVGERHFNIKVSPAYVSKYKEIPNVLVLQMSYEEFDTFARDKTLQQ